MTDLSVSCYSALPQQCELGPSLGLTAEPTEVAISGERRRPTLLTENMLAKEQTQGPWPKMLAFRRGNTQSGRRGSVTLTMHRGELRNAALINNVLRLPMPPTLTNQEA